MVWLVDNLSISHSNFFCLLTSEKTPPSQSRMRFKTEKSDFAGRGREARDKPVRDASDFCALWRLQWTKVLQKEGSETTMHDEARPRPWDLALNDVTNLKSLDNE